MKHQFYLCSNPNRPEDPSYIYHAKEPRFFAEITDEGLQLAVIIDEATPEKLQSKLRRMLDWYIHFKKNERSR